jgi:hypothetical protein
VSAHDDETQAFRPSARPFVTALVANLALAVLLLGLPYVRGRDRARESARGVVELSACLLDGVPREELGLALPIGERERFATLFERGPEDWPARCAAILPRIDHAPATFILPTPKAAELDLHGALESMGEALLDLASARAQGTAAVPERPLEVLGQLRGLAASLLTANDLAIDPTVVGIDLRPSDASLPVASRVPVRTGAGFLHVEAGALPALRVVAADGLGVAEVEVTEPAEPAGAARLTLLQLRRPGGARGVVVGEDDAWLAWTTAATTCDADPRHCAMRATGLGRLSEGSRVMRPEHWLAAHPAGPTDRAIHVAGERFTVMARTPDGGVEARVFPRGEPLPAPEPSGPDAAVEPTRAIGARAIGAALDWVVGEGTVGALVESPTGREVRSVLVGADPASDVVVPVAATAEILVGCDRFVVAIAAGGFEVVLAGAVWARGGIEARAPLRGPSPEVDSVRVACGEDRVAVGALDARGGLVVHVCTQGGCASHAWPRGGVGAFDVAVVGDDVWCLSSSEGSPQVRASRVPVSGTPPVVAACWDSHTGVCGPARFATGEGRLVLTAREGSDVLALALGPNGFEGLRGLVSGH